MNYRLALLFWLACALPAWSQAPAPAPGSVEYVQEERGRITAQRQDVQARFAVEQAACYKRFAVTDCQQESRVRRRDELADLRRQEISLNDAERKKRGAEQTRKVESKVAAEKLEQAEAQRDKAKEAQARRVLDAAENDARRQQLKEHEPASKARQQREADRHEQDAAVRTNQASEGGANAQRYEEKLKDAAEHKAQRKEKSSKKTKPPAQPLPAPS
ncbi:MAG TPA: hypothetical protein VLJ57_02620 [Burkholderiaceae bacterium]|nr:hypothetical protein [Burkholderiaceae bacterium]